MIGKIILYKIKINDSESLCPWPDFRQVEEYIPIFFTVSYSDKQRYNHQLWSIIPNIEQFDIMHTHLIEAFKQYKRIMDIHNKIYVIYELNKSFNVHSHGIFYIKKGLSWIANFAYLHKIIQKISKCGTYGVDISEVKDLSNVMNYCAKDIYRSEEINIM